MGIRKFGNFQAFDEQVETWESNLSAYPRPPKSKTLEAQDRGWGMRRECQIPKLKNGELGNGGELSNMKASLMILDVKVKYLCP